MKTLQTPNRCPCHCLGDESAYGKFRIVVLVRRNLWDSSLVSTNGRCPLVEVRLYSCLPT